MLLTLPDNIDRTRIPGKKTYSLEVEPRNINIALEELSEQDTVRGITYDSVSKKLLMIIEHQVWVPKPLPYIVGIS